MLAHCGVRITVRANGKFVQREDLSVLVVLAVVGRHRHRTGSAYVHVAFCAVHAPTGKRAPLPICRDNEDSATLPLIANDADWSILGQLTNQRHLR